METKRENKFRPGNRVVFVGDEFDIFSNLTPYKTYTVVNTYVSGEFIDTVNDKKQQVRYKSKFFVSLQEYRRMKLEKLKEKICSKLGIK